MFNDWNGMTMVGNNTNYAMLKYHYANWDYSLGSIGNTHINFYKHINKRLLEKGKAVTSDLLDLYAGIVMHKVFSIPQVYFEKWEQVQVIYRMHLQLWRYYDYNWNEEDDHDGSRNQKNKKEKEKGKRKVFMNKEKRKRSNSRDISITESKDYLNRGGKCCNPRYL
eukprot:15341086-Ditylum_brightwellii.AAC.1